MANGLYANIAAKKARIKAGSGEKMRKVGAPLLPTLRIFSPDPALIRAFLAAILAYSPLAINDLY